MSTLLPLIICVCIVHNRAVVIYILLNIIIPIVNFLSVAVENLVIQFQFQHYIFDEVLNFLMKLLIIKDISLVRKKYACDPPKFQHPFQYLDGGERFFCDHPNSLDGGERPFRGHACDPH